MAPTIINHIMLRKIVIKKKYCFLFLIFIITQVQSQEIVYDSLFIIIENSNEAKYATDTLFGYDKDFHSKAVRYGAYEKYFKENFNANDNIDYSLPWKEYLFIYPWDLDKWKQGIAMNMYNIEICNRNFDNQMEMVNCYARKTNFAMKMENPIILFRCMNQLPISIDIISKHGNKERNSFFYLSNNYRLDSLAKIVQYEKHKKIFVGKEQLNRRYIFYEYNYFEN